MQQFILSKKMSSPKIPPTFIERAAIFDTLQAHAARRCTIVRAPAGYGKTSVLNAWLQRQGEPIAWVSLDAADNDFVRFWLYVATSVARATNRELGAHEQALIQAKDIASFEFFLHAFIEELTWTQQSLHIVLDDYHVIDEQKIHLLLSKLMEHLPERVHVYITTRTELPLPVAKWRVKQWVTEIHYEQLKFTLAEAQHFFAQTSVSHFSEEQLKQIVAKTEGWVSGLLLTSLANPLEGQVVQPFVEEFLWQEVLAEQPAHVQHFLLHTSILEELEPAICDALLGQEQSARMLQQLVASGLFTVRLQTEQPTYKYHPLLQEALRAELMNRYSAGEVRRLAQHAAQLIYDKKDSVSAIELALRYELYPQALHWMQEQVIHLYETGQTMTYMRWLQRVRHAGVPIQEELLIAGLMNAVSLFDIKLAHELVEELEARQKQTGWMDKVEHIGIVKLYIRTKAYFFCALGDRLPEVMTLLNNQLVKGTEPHRWDAINMSYNHFEPHLMRLSIAAKGKLISLEQLKQVVSLFRFTALKTLAVSPYLFGSAAEMLYELDEPTEAEQERVITLQMGHEKNQPGLYIPMYLLKAKLYMYDKQPSLAQALLQEVVQNESEKHWQNVLKMMQAHCFIKSGEWTNAVFLLATTKSPLPFWQLTQARLLMAKGEHSQALSLLIPVKVTAQREEQLTTVVEAAVLESICHDKLGNMRAATRTLHEVLPFAAQYGYVRTFLDEPEIRSVLDYYTTVPFYTEQWTQSQTTYMKKIQQRLMAEAKTQPQIYLTKREKQLLQLLVEGASNIEIARALGLSEGTVRVYLSTLYSKIGVTSRVQAVLFGQQQEGLWR